jgi:hypothetical protein
MKILLLRVKSYTVCRSLTANPQQIHDTAVKIETFLFGFHQFSPKSKSGAVNSIIFLHVKIDQLFTAQDELIVQKLLKIFLSSLNYVPHSQPLM